MFYKWFIKNNKESLKDEYEKYDKNLGLYNKTISGEINLIKSGNIVENSEFFQNNTLNEVFGKGITKIEAYAFEFSKIKKASFVNVKEIETNAFASCKDLIEVNFPNLETLRSNVFASCINLERIIITKAETIHPTVFWDCKNVKMIKCKRGMKDLIKKRFKDVGINPVFKIIEI